MGLFCTQCWAKAWWLLSLAKTRQGSVATERLKTFNGLLQTDGYTGYNALRKRDEIVGFGCFSHARRKFSEVVKISGDKHGIAAEMIERMKPLYALRGADARGKNGTSYSKATSAKNSTPDI